MSEVKPKIQSSIHPAERLFGFHETVSFSEALEESLVTIENERKQNTDGRGLRIKKELEEEAEEVTALHGLNLDCSLINRSDIEGFSSEDWGEIARSSNPLMRLLSKRTLQHEMWQEKSYPKLRTREMSLSEKARLRSLPFVHGMTAEAFSSVLESGELLPNRALFERSQMGSSEFVDSGLGMTVTQDRELGLDGYIFADFARPDTLRSHTQPEVLLVLDPDVLQQDGAFLTEKDIMDCHGLSVKPPIDEYVETLSTPEDFYETAGRRIPRLEIGEIRDGKHGYATRYNSLDQFVNGQDSEPTNMQPFSFSTWEAKLPEVPVSMIRKVIVKDPQLFERLNQLDSFDFEVVLEPNLAPAGEGVSSGGYESIEIPGRQEHEFSKLVHEDYLERRQQIDELEEEDLEEVFIVFPRGLSPEQSLAVTTETNPGMYLNAMKIYSNLDALVQDANYATERGEVDFMVPLTERRFPGWLYESGGRTERPVQGDMVLARFVRSKDNPAIGVIEELTKTNIRELAY